jgi:hypothetical protein
LWDSHEFAGVQVFRMRTGITVHLNPIDRKRLQVIVDDRNSPQKHVWRARIVLASSISRPAINRFVVDHNRQPKPFVWTADPDEIIAAATRGHQVLTSVR